VGQEVRVMDGIRLPPYRKEIGHFIGCVAEDDMPVVTGVS